MLNCAFFVTKSLVWPTWSPSGIVYVPHGSSIAALVFIMTLAAGPRGAGSSHFFSKVSYFANCQLACLEPENYCFSLLWALAATKRSFSWDMHNLFSCLHDLNLWALGIKHPKEVYFSQSQLPWKMLISTFSVSKSPFWPNMSSLGS